MLIEQWDDRLADGVASPNLFLDRSKDRRRREFEQLHATLGTCRTDAGFTEVENALRGSWMLRCERGEARAELTLAPTMPPTVQYFEVQPLPGGAPAARRSCPDR